MLDLGAGSGFLCAMGYTPITRLYLDAALSAASRIALDRDQGHYLVTVMRKRVGDRIAVFNGVDGEWHAIITEADRKRCSLQIDTLRRPQAPEADLWLAYAPIKKVRADFIAQKATELGASRLMPVMTARTNADRVNLDRLRANAVEAAEQSERLTVPGVDAVEKLATVLDAWPGERPLLFCDESLTGRMLAVAAPALPPGPKGVLIGPEGGFTDAERSLITAHPAAVAVTLGPRILRADTAALAALAVVQATAGDWQAIPQTDI